jgi:integrase
VSVLADHVADYLRLRREMGFKLEFPGHVLPQLVAYLDEAGASTLTVELAVAWARLPAGRVQPIQLAHRLGAARGFARYLATIDPATEVPPLGICPSLQRRPTPFLWAPADIAALLDAARHLDPPLRAASHETLFGLLAATGMRIGEAMSLSRDDVDLVDEVITIRDSKFARPRLVPLHRTVTDALVAYTAQRDRLCPQPASTTFFITSVGTALHYSSVRQTFNEMTTTMGLRTATTRPRIHDLRHSFAVRTLIDWHRSGVDIDGQMPVLSTYLGHICPSGTFWYLSAAPELMELVAARLDNRYRVTP